LITYRKSRKDTQGREERRRRWGDLSQPRRDTLWRGPSSRMWNQCWACWSLQRRRLSSDLLPQLNVVDGIRALALESAHHLADIGTPTLPRNCAFSKVLRQAEEKEAPLPRGASPLTLPTNDSTADCPPSILTATVPNAPLFQSNFNSASYARGSNLEASSLPAFLPNPAPRNPTA
jgi:hypothetical protein